MRPLKNDGRGRHATPPSARAGAAIAHGDAGAGGAHAAPNARTVKTIMAARMLDGMEGGSSSGGGSGGAPGERRPAPVIRRGIVRSGAGRPRGRPAVDGPCGCGWGDALSRGSALRRMLAGVKGDRSAACGCATAVIARVAFEFSVDPTAKPTVTITPPPNQAMPRTTRLMLEAVVPDGPWRIFIGDAANTAAATLFGPYTSASDTVTVAADTVKLLRDTGMTVRIDGDFERVMETFRASGVETPSAAEITGG